MAITTPNDSLAPAGPLSARRDSRPEHESSMRHWPLHPRCLDARGLVALWREALLAQAVRRGYRFDARKIGRSSQRRPIGE